MIINPKLSCLVLDLDDTLYKEYDYQTSGLRYVESQILRLYGENLEGKLLKFRDQGVDDIFMEAVKVLKMPMSLKESLLMMYRFHKPDIELTLETKHFLQSAYRNFKQVVILTDGRSVTQRLKLESLGLMKIPAFISEEWCSQKPSAKRFIAIMEKYTNCSQFCYIADNLSKDFIAPNDLGWMSVCLRGDQRNIHAQEINKTDESALPDVFITHLSDIYTC